MGATTNALLTFEEFEQLPDEPGKLELLEGEVSRMPPPESAHNMTATRIAVRLTAWLERNGPEGAEAGVEVGYALTGASQSFVRPDVSVPHAGQPGPRFFQGAPLVAFEIVSPSETAQTLLRKVKLYLDHGCREVWLVYPGLRELYVCTPEEPRPTPQEAIRSQVLPGLEITLDQFLR